MQVDIPKEKYMKAQVLPEVYNYDSFPGLKNYETEVFVPDEIKQRDVGTNTRVDLDVLIHRSIRHIGVNTYPEPVKDSPKKHTRNVGINVNFEDKEVVKEKVVVTETVYVPEYVQINAPKNVKNASTDVQSLLFEQYKKSCRDIGVDPVLQLKEEIKIQLSNKAIDTRDELIWEEEIERAKQEGTSIYRRINTSI